jgi:4-amino-4-deoxy-L-arabinose transferase-like glycosyltransferase
MATTIVRPTDPTHPPAIRHALLFAAIIYQAHIGYGYFRDEFYYIACGRHLAWGYVDHGPIVALQARIATTLFGRSLAGIRLLSALAGAARVFLTGLLAWSIGGKRPAQALAMIACLVAPIYLGLDSYLSMNSCESLFWMTAVLALILMLRRGLESPSLTLWLLWAVACGLGLLNKPSMTFFLTALLIGILLTPARRLLANRYAALGIALMILIALPNLLWQIHNHWPTLEFLHNGRVENKNIALNPLALIAQQIVVLQPVSVLIWAAGLVYLLRNPAAKPYRWLGFTYLIFLAIMMALHAKDYYIAPIYPILFAAGGIAWENRFAASAAVQRQRIYAFPILETILLAAAILFLPLSLPILRPPTYIVYAKALHMGNVGNSETESSGPLPQFYADRFGWQEEVDQVTRIYNSLSPQDRAQAAILCSNYGEAGAIDFLGHGLPPAISGHNNYFLWGPHGATGEVVIAISAGNPDDFKQYYDQVEIAGRMDTPYSMPFEHRNIYLLRHRKSPLAADWPDFKHYI